MAEDIKRTKITLTESERKLIADDVLNALISGDSPEKALTQFIPENLIYIFNHPSNIDEKTDLYAKYDGKTLKRKCRIANKLLTKWSKGYEKWKRSIK